MRVQVQANLYKTARQYSSEAPKSGGGMFRNLLLVSAASAGGYYYYTNVYDSKLSKASTEPASKVFTGGDQGFVSLRLDKIETVNHNTKRFRFVFDDPEAVSGLTIACEELPSLTFCTNPESCSFDKVPRSKPGKAICQTIHSHQRRRRSWIS
jgi:hypothetical protein